MFPVIIAVWLPPGGGPAPLRRCAVTGRSGLALRSQLGAKPPWRHRVWGNEIMRRQPLKCCA